MNAQARLGAFLLLSLILLGVFSSKIGRIHWFEEEGQQVEALFHDVAGVAQRTPVLMAGVKIGTVEQIRLEGNEALVIMRIAPNIRLPRSTHARIEGGGLIGEKYIALSAEPGDETPLAGRRIPSEETGNMNALLKKTENIASDLQRLFAKIETVTGTIDAMLDENRKPLRDGLQSLRNGAHTLSDLLTRHQRDLDRLLRELPALSRESQTFFKEGRAVMQQARGILTDNRENLYRTLFELRKASENLELLSEDLRLNPWKLLIEKPEIKPPQHPHEHDEELIMTTGHLGPAERQR